MGGVSYQPEGQRQGFEHILERNAVAREVCRNLGVRLIDLFAAFNTENLADFREHFIDMIHLRPSAYPLVAERVYDGIKDLLA
jgi:lysophospholipase L1-like esterase